MQSTEKSLTGAPAVCMIAADSATCVTWIIRLYGQADRSIESLCEQTNSPPPAGNEPGGGHDRSFVKRHLGSPVASWLKAFDVLCLIAASRRVSLSLIRSMARDVSGFCR